MKMMLKKLLCLAAIFFAFSINQAICAPSDDFTDTHQGYWSYDAIMALKKIGVLAGYPDGSFRPDENVTRAEFTAMITKALGLRDAKDFQSQTIKTYPKNTGHTEIFKLHLITVLCTEHPKIILWQTVKLKGLK